MSKPKIELKVGQIWGVLPLEKTLEIRRITYMWTYDSNVPSSLEYTTICGEYIKVSHYVFHSWITRKHAVLIGHYDFKTGKAVKGGKK